ncbi:hypothetical protein IB265_33060 [Ensifer sp. ENS10]|uniref:hypothetical protein n=1 Tax=Ensifer sp. ENS10 TaxID=2769286 RepID=UPI0017821D2E|nr:hypothetical protein [Ensifer sp. ENS10]MBD9511588.1 hypothetical protein [Ensifer sp. ENS10]
MPAPIKTLKELLAHGTAEGWSFKCFYEDPAEPDYEGKDKGKALEALEACDIMHLGITDAAGFGVGSVVIVNDASMDPEEQIADYGGTRLSELLA